MGVDGEEWMCILKLPAAARHRLRQPVVPVFGENSLNRHAADTTERSPLPRRLLGRQIAVVVICAIVSYWYGFTLYQRLTRTWYVTHNIQGFVAYGYHEVESSPDGSQAAIARGEQSKVLDLASGKELSRLEKYSQKGLSDFSSDGKIISRFTGNNSDGQKAYLWNASDGRMLGSIDAPDDENFEKCFPFFSPDGKKIVAAFDQGVVVWDSTDLKWLAQVEIAWSEMEWYRRVLAWNPANQELTAVDNDGTLLRIDLSQDTARPMFAEQQRPVTRVEWSPDGTRLLTIDRDDKSVAVWNVETEAMVATILQNDVDYAYFSPSGKDVVTLAEREDIVRERWTPSVWDRSTKIWDATTGKLVSELPTIGIVTFSPDWSWRAETGPEGLRIARFDGSESCRFPGWFDGHGCSCTFAQDNSFLASINGSGRVVIWRQRDPARFWTECVTDRNFLLTVLPLIILMWALSGFRTWKAPMKQGLASVEP